MRPSTILCVDDDLNTLKVRRLLLEGEGYTVLTAASASEALQIIEAGTPIDIVLLDYIMPGMNGDELAAKLRQLRPYLPLIAVSAVGQLPEVLIESVDSHLQKGQDPLVLLSRVSDVLAGSGNRVRNTKNAGSTGKVVLCVEDEESQLRLRRLLFESEGYVVLTARSGEAALEIFRSQHVDVVVMDYWLSGQNGSAVAEEMKQLRPMVPVAMLSGFTSLPGEGAVVDLWLRKAEIEPEDLVKEVERLIDLRRAQQSATP